MDTITVTPRSATLPSPKVTKAKPPTLSSNVPTVSCGCEHLQQFFDDEKTRDSCVKQYTRLQLVLNERHASIPQTLTPANPESRITISLLPTYLCLQCSAVHTPALRDRHFEQRKHNFSVESSSGCLYCQQCQDFIYDPWLEDVRLEKGRSKRKFEELTNEDAKLIVQNSNFLPCRAIGLRGMYNMGQTCFMSVILQALIHNPFLKAYYLTEGHRSGTCEREGCTSCSLDEIFTEFYSIEKTEGYGAVSMLLGSWLGAQALAGYSQQDAHEYLQFILNNLHQANSGPSPSSTPSSGGQTQNTSNSDADCNCIIHQTFSGKLHSTVKCSKCKNTTTALDPFLDLSLDLRNQAKKRKLDGEKTEDGVFDLKDCLERFTSEEKLPKGEYSCNNCGDTPQDAVKQLSMQKLPPVLCIHLKRFSHTPSSSQKLSTPIRFPMLLDMYPFTTQATKPATPSARVPTATYDLNAVIVHKGGMDSGHYVSYSKEGDDWFMFDDSKVVLVNEKEVLAAEAYLLLYIVEELSV